MPDIKDAKRQVHDAMTEAGALPQWEHVLTLALKSATAERDAAREQIHRLEEENGRLRGQLELLQSEHDRAQQGFEREHDRRLATEKALVAAGNAAAETIQERDSARRQLAEKQRQVEDWEAEALKYHQQARNLEAALSHAREELTAARVAADASREHDGQGATPAWSPCPRIKAKQFGPATFVVRRCKLTDGHDGQCEPA